LAAIGVLSVQGAVSEHIDLIRRCGAEALPVKKPADLKRLDGLIIPGGESTTIGSLMKIYGLNDAITVRHHEGMAVFGTCAGMVILARELLDGYREQPRLALMDIIVRRNAFGRQKESFEAPVLVKGIDTPVEGVFIRAPVIVEAGNAVEVLAAREEGIVAARQGKLLAVSFHPELTDDLRMHRFFLEMCRA
jgi:5'-phosphate synthase pdxT subunit